MRTPPRLPLTYEGHEIGYVVQMTPAKPRKPDPWDCVPGFIIPAYDPAELLIHVHAEHEHILRATEFAPGASIKLSVDLPAATQVLDVPADT